MTDRELLNHGFPGSTWGNLGYWRNAPTYPDACLALGILLGERAQLRAGQSVLDIGFGFGDQLQLWKTHFGVGPVTGVERDAAALAAAQKRLADFADIALHLDTEGILAKTGCFDRVLALDCAYHFNLRSDFFSDAFQALRPGGVLALTDIVMRDGSQTTRHTGLARACGIPPQNLVTHPVYRQTLVQQGFEAVEFEFLDDHVLLGFSRFATRHLWNHRRLAAHSGALKIMATAMAAAWLGRKKHIHYVLVTAIKPA